MSSPTERAIAFCKSNGWPRAVVEKWNPHTKTRADLWGCIDMLVLDDEPGTLGVQACAGASHAARARKVHDTILGVTPAGASPLGLGVAAAKSIALLRWLEKGNRLEVWSFAKHGARGKRKVYTLRRERITASWQPLQEPEQKT